MWRDWTEFANKVGIFVGLAAFFISLINLGFYYNFNQDRLRLETKIVELDQEIFELTNFNTSIFGSENFVFLESILFQRDVNGTINNIHLRGNLKTTITILTPHYGRFEIVIKNFTLHKSIFFREGTEKYTDVQFVKQPDGFFTYQGLNSYNLELQLACLIHPNLELLPPPGESVQIVLGVLNFQITFYDEQFPETIKHHNFITEAQGIIKMPLE